VVAKVPEAYYQFIIDYAPYVYVIPDSGPDVEWGRAAFAAAFAVDFLCEAYSSAQFEDRRTGINSKIVNLASWILTQQCTDEAKLAYGGFKSNENSTYYYSVDACRIIPSLLKAYELTSDADYLNAAKLAAATFLYNMQRKPSELGVHDKYYGGFARAVTMDDMWLREIDVECLYGLIGLKLLCENDSENATKYESMMSDAVAFMREGFENLWLYFDPKPSGNGGWHRSRADETVIYDDSFAYALSGLYDYEGWNPTVQKVYSFLNTIRASAKYPAYNPAICWAGYLDVVSASPACDYYDAVTSGILWKIREARDKPSVAFSMEFIDKHQGEFMFWGVKHSDCSPLENKQAMATVCWLSMLYLHYENPVTRFTQVANSKGESLTLYSIRAAGEKVSYGEALDFKAVVSQTRVDEILIEPGYVMNDYIAVYTFAPLRVHDKVRRKGEDYEVQSVQAFDFSGETAYFKCVCRRLIGQ
jgi:hypothetical protein